MDLVNDSKIDQTIIRIGTPFRFLSTEWNKPKSTEPNKPNLYSIESQGRKRFHGAFTGGFSAGYFNTVGSVEGFTPSQFVSSRVSRNANKKQKVEDFMDEEDLDHLTAAGVTEKTVAPPHDLFSEMAQDPNRKYAERLKIGFALLRTSGWKDGTTIGPRLSRDEKLSPNVVEEDQRRFTLQPEEEIEDRWIFEVAVKKDFCGLGFAPSKTRWGRDGRNKVMRWGGDGEQNKDDKFGLNGLEEETESFVYSSAREMEDYDFSISTEVKDGAMKIADERGEIEEKTRSDVIEGFVVAKEKMKMEIAAGTEVKVPESFLRDGCRHRFDRPGMELTKELKKFDIKPPQRRRNLTAKEKGKLLGEKKLGDNFFGARPISNSLKTNFVVGKVLNITDAEIRGGLNVNKKTREKEITCKSVEEGTKNKEDDKIFRTESQWRPDNLLCKRFNVPNPYKSTISKTESDYIKTLIKQPVRKDYMSDDSSDRKSVV